MRYQKLYDGNSIYWVPDHAHKGMVLLLGRLKADWDDPVLSAHARHLAERGYVAVAFETVNWGNTNDADIIGLLSFVAKSKYPIVASRLGIIGYGRGAISAVNYASRQPHTVAGVALVDPIVDLYERWERVPADRASLEAAYGGSTATFNAARTTWGQGDPVELNWARRFEEFIADRTTMWLGDDAATPIAVNLSIASRYGMGLQVRPSTAGVLADRNVVDYLIEGIEGWTQQPAVDYWNKWSQYRRNNSLNTDWAGGDGDSTLAVGSEYWRFFSDTMTGAVNADESRAQDAFANFESNALVIESAAGVLGATTTNFVEPADAGAGAWYWAGGGGYVDGNNVRLTALHVTPNEGGWVIDGRHIVTLDATTKALTNVAVMSFLPSRPWSHVAEDGDMLYITSTFYEGTHPLAPLEGRTLLARVPKADFAADAAWRYWDGDAWVVNQALARPLMTLGHGRQVPVNGGSLYKVGDLWILTGHLSTFHHYWSIYVSRTGPSDPDSWELWEDIYYPANALRPFGGVLFTYGGHYMVPQAPGLAADEMLFSYSVNYHTTPESSVDGHTRDSALYQPRYLVVKRPTL